MSGFSDLELGMELGFPIWEDFLEDGDFVVDSDECSLNYLVDVVADDDYDNVEDDDDDGFVSSVPLFWDSLQLADGPNLEDFNDDVAVEWEEINGCVDEGEVLSMIFDVDDHDGGNATGFEVDGVDCDGDIDDGVDVVDLEALGNLEWEVLYELGFDSALEDETARLPVFVDDDDDFYAAEYDPLFGRSDNGSLGLQPASNSVIEELASSSVVCTGDEDRICAICKDGLSVGEKVTKMPCDHVYHSDCIFTWLQIRNTCPVCRHELPTKDADSGREGTAAMEDVE